MCIRDRAEDVGVLFTAGDQSGTNLVFDDFMATTTSGTSFTFDLTISAGEGVGEIFVMDGVLNGSLSEIDTGETDGSLFENGDTITVVISDIQGAVTFDGFVNFGTDNSGNGEGFTSMESITFEEPPLMETMTLVKVLPFLEGF